MLSAHLVLVPEQTIRYRYPRGPSNHVNVRVAAEVKLAVVDPNASAHRDVNAVAIHVAAPVNSVGPRSEPNVGPEMGNREFVGL